MKWRLPSQRGGVLVMFAVAMVAILAGSGLAIDIGRMYVTRTEAQSFVDALALARAAEMIGSREPNAGDVWKLYNFNNESFDGADVTVDYSSSAGFGAGTVTPGPTAASLYVRARADVDVPLMLIRAVVPDEFATVSATAVAEVSQVTSLSEGSWPYTVRGIVGNFDTDDIGTQYTFRWGNQAGADLMTAYNYVKNYRIANNMGTEINAMLADTATILGGGNPFATPLTGQVKNINTWCEGHATQEFLTLLNAADAFDDGIAPDAFSWTGSFFQGGTNDIVAAMAYGYQEIPVTVGEAVEVATGVRQATVNELEWVINQDGEKTTNVPSEYAASSLHNNMRVIIAPVVEAGTVFLKPGSGATATIQSLAAFLLLVPAKTSYGNPQSNWCAVYYGAVDANTKEPVERPAGVWRLRLIS